MMGRSELRIARMARPEAARPIRHAVAAFLAASGRVDGNVSDDILTAVGEALANAVEHAYAGVPENIVEVCARLEDDDTVAVDVFDRGTFITRAPRPNRGFGLRIVEAIAQNVTVNTDGGTHVRMIFSLAK
jgi:anti-sigma regulatory factor (Ser/Thr protein kinase)